MKRKTNYAGVIALLLIGAAGVYGIGAYIKRTPEAQNVPPQVRVSTAPDTTHPAERSDKQASATVLTPKSHEGKLTFDKATEDVPKGTSPIVFAVNRYLENAHITPPGAKAIAVDVRDGTAYIDCTEAMDKTYGSSDEETLLQGLGKTVGQFPNIKKFQFLISGKPIETFGNVDISEGIDVIRPDDDSTPPGA